jgi:hypothetical protein
MSSADRRIVVKEVAANIALAGVLSIGAAVALAATAAADDPPAPPPAPDAPAGPPDIPQTAMGTMSALLNQTTTSPTGFDLLLSQTPVPAQPGTQPPTPPDLSAVNSLPYLFGPNMKLSEQGQQSMYSNGPTDPNAPEPNGRIDAFQRAHGIWHEGMGRLDLSQLGQPLPGTAPPPGTNLPPGPEQFLP